METLNQPTHAKQLLIFWKKQDVQFDERFLNQVPEELETQRREDQNRLFLNLRLLKEVADSRQLPKWMPQEFLQTKLMRVIPYVWLKTEKLVSKIDLYFDL